MKKLILISMLFYSCHPQKGIQQETRQRIIAHKEFIRTLSFEGVISENIYCEKCELNKYQLVITLKEMPPKTISNQIFQPYYFFNVNNKLTISVIKALYDAAQKGLNVEKQSNTDYLTIEKKDYKLINDDRYKWLPN